MSRCALLHLDQLGVAFPGPYGPVRVVDGLDLTLSAGEVTALVGVSGSGKTVTGLAILGLLPCEATVSGRRLWRGEPLDGGPAHRARLGREIAMIFQDPGACLDPVWTVGAQLVETVRATSEPGRAAAEIRAEALLAEVHLPATIRARYPHQLSGGQKQRVMLALALAGNPDLLIADEPTTALDVTIQAGVLDTLQSVVRRRGMAMLFITHDLSLASGFADRLAVIHEGRVVELGDAAVVLGDPTRGSTRELLAALPENGPRRGALPARADGPVLDLRALRVERSRRTALRRRQPPAVTAVRDVDLTVHAGEAVALVGESGCGKTSLALAVTGHLVRSGGEFRLDGEHRPPGAPSRSAQLIFQDASAALDPRQSCGDAIAEAAAAAGDAQADVAARLREVSLPPELATRRPHQLSGGQRQRVALARALAARPRLLVADEPTASLDVVVQARIVALLRGLQDAQGWGLLWITHDLPLARSICHRLVVMYRGAVVEELPAGADPLHPYTRELVAMTPRLGHPLPHTVALSAPGEAPPPEGCAYAPRCPLAEAACSRANPPLIDAAEGRRLRCPPATRSGGTH
ncbi:ABC transporter ATP-binding protein [bacterium]|nr:ABC transporter ATP-binding protein [bacterium]